MTTKCNYRLKRNMDESEKDFAERIRREIAEGLTTAAYPLGDVFCTYRRNCANYGPECLKCRHGWESKYENVPKKQKEVLNTSELLEGW